MSRREVLAAGGAAATGLVAAGALSACTGPSNDASAVDLDRYLESETVAFDGDHQAGIDTPHQAHLQFVGFTFADGLRKDDLRRLLRMWTDDSRMMTAGTNPPGSLEPELMKKPANLTVTCGLGPKFFEILGVDKADRPAGFQPVPAFATDQLDPQWGQADVVLQICSDDPVTAAFTLRHLTRVAPTYVTTKFIQTGFLNAAGASGGTSTPRNLFGQLDGTINPRGEEQFDEQVWIDEGPEWTRGGSILVARRIHTNLDSWEMLDRASRENAMGRRLSDGAPLTGGEEHDEVDLTALDQYGLPVIDRNSHVARAKAPADHPEQRLLRRAYNYNLPPDPARPDELTNAGLVFLCYQKDSAKQFSAIQARLAEKDLLNTWTTHIGSGVYWVPPGTGATGDSYWAQRLIESV